VDNIASVLPAGHKWYFCSGEHAETYSWTLVTDFSDIASGKNGRRPGFLRETHAA